MTCLAQAMDCCVTIPTSCQQAFENLGDFAQLGAKIEEGIFVLLPDEMRLEVFEKLIIENDWSTLNTASQVNWCWKQEIEYLWRKHCERNQLLMDEEIWAKKGKNWKWVCQCLTRFFHLENAPDGFGSTHKSVAAGEAKYEGEWKDGKKEGVGRMWWNNGDRYLGDWKNDTKDGSGYMMWENGDIYEGSWKQDLRHGESAYYFYSNGGKFQGDYVNDERHGPGVFYWPDGDRFEGTWQSGGRHGKGKLILKNGTVIEQEWNESPFVNYSEGLPAKHPDGTTPSTPAPSHPHSG